MVLTECPKSAARSLTGTPSGNQHVCVKALSESMVVRLALDTELGNKTAKIQLIAVLLDHVALGIMK